MLSRPYLVDILVGTRSAEAVNTKLLVCVSFPTHGAHDLNGQGWDTIRQHRKSVLLGLRIKDLEARNGDNASLDTVLLFEILGSVHADANLRASRNQCDVGARNFTQDVTTLAGLLNGGTLKLGQVLSGQSHDTGSVLGSQGNVVSSAGLVAVGRAPDHAVRQGTEVSQSLNRLVSRTVLSKTNGVVSGNPNDADLGQSRETDSTSTIGDKVQEGTAVRQDSTVSGETIHDGSHTMLTDTVADISTRIVSEPSSLGLEVNRGLPTGQVGASQISRTTEELRDGAFNLAQHSLRKFARSDGGVGGGVDGQVLFPALRKVTRLAALEIGSLVGELLSVLAHHLVPLVLVGGTLGGMLAVKVVDFLGDMESILGETPLLLELLNVIGLEGRAVDTVGTLLERAKANGGLEFDQRRLVLDLLALLDGSFDGSEVRVAVVDDFDMPAVGFVSLDNILGEGAVGVAINGNVVIIVNADQVAELKMTSQ